MLLPVWQARWREALLRRCWNRHVRDELLMYCRIELEEFMEGGGPDMQGDPGRLGGVLVAYVR